MLLALLLLLPASPWAAPSVGTEGDGPYRIPPLDSAFYREVRSIPYPSGSIYVARGITGSFLGGKYQKGGQRSLYQWQGDLAFYYTRWFSGGVGFKINAGEPSDTAQRVNNRYFMQARFHLAHRRLAAFLGPQVGLENLNILSGAPDPTRPSKEIRDPIDDTKASLGMEAGLGWKASRWAGLTLGSICEYSFVDETDSEPDDNLNFRLNPGVSVDVLAFTDTLRGLVPALYVNFEFQLGFLILQDKRRNNDQAFIGGVSLAF